MNVAYATKGMLTLFERLVCLVMEIIMIENVPSTNRAKIQTPTQTKTHIHRQPGRFLLELYDKQNGVSLLKGAKFLFGLSRFEYPWQQGYLKFHFLTLLAKPSASYCRNGIQILNRAQNSPTSQINESVHTKFVVIRKRKRLYGIRSKGSVIWQPL